MMNGIITYKTKAYEKLDEMSGYLEKIGVDSLFTERNFIFLVIAVVVIIAILVILDKDEDETSVVYSVIRGVKRFVIVAADLFGDIISLFSSLSEIINLIRILIFGKTDSQTQILLANYAIIFMSVVSYSTSMNGMIPVIGNWQAILASFGVQVGILVFSSRLAQKLDPLFYRNRKHKEIYVMKKEGEKNDEKTADPCQAGCHRCVKREYLKGRGNARADKKKQEDKREQGSLEEQKKKKMVAGDQL